MFKNPGKISICATPVGNLGDISKRVQQTLSNAEIIYAEDTRVASKLLAALGLPKKPLKRIDENKMKLGLEELESDLNDGKHIVYVSDAGMPGVSDPGLQIVCLAREKAFSLEVLPGPSAAVLAYVHSGFEAEDFYFAGFLPRKEGQIAGMIKELQNLQAALIFYESPKRIIKTLKA